MRLRGACCALVQVVLRLSTFNVFQTASKLAPLKSTATIPQASWLHITCKGCGDTTAAVEENKTQPGWQTRLFRTFRFVCKQALFDMEAAQIRTHCYPVPISRWRPWKGIACGLVLLFYNMSFVKGQTRILLASMHKQTRPNNSRTCAGHVGFVVPHVSGSRCPPPSRAVLLTPTCPVTQNQHDSEKPGGFTLAAYLLPMDAAFPRRLVLGNCELEIMEMPTDRLG